MGNAAVNATDRQAFFDQMRQIDQRIDELRGCMMRMHGERKLTAMERRYVLGKGRNPFILNISVHRENDETPVDPVTVEVLAGLVEAVTVEVNEKGGGGYLLARLSDARDCLKQRMRRK